MKRKFLALQHTYNSSEDGNYITLSKIASQLYSMSHWKPESMHIASSANSASVLDHEVSKSILQIQNLSSFYKIGAKINEIHLSTTQFFPKLPTNYYRELVELFKFIDLYIKFSKEEITSVFNKNYDAPRITFTDVWECTITRVEEKLLKIIKTQLVYKFQQIILDLSITSNLVDKRMNDILFEISQWNKLIKSFWESIWSVTSNQSYKRLLVLQISALELCLRVCDVRFYHFTLHNHIPRRKLKKSEGGSHILGRKISRLTLPSTDPLKENMRTGSRFLERINTFTLSIDPLFETDEYINSTVTRQGDSVFPIKEIFHCEMHNRTISIDTLKFHLETHIAEEHEVLKDIISILESSEDLYIPLYDTNFNCDLTYTYYKHKVHGSTIDAKINSGETVINFNVVNRQIFSICREAIDPISSDQELLDRCDMYESEYLLPYIGSSLLNIFECSSHYISVLFQRLSLSCNSPSIIGMNFLIGNISGSILKNTSQKTSMLPFEKSSPSKISEDVRSKIQREYMKLLPVLLRLEQKEDFSYHKRFLEVQKSEVFACQTQFFRSIISFLKILKALKDEYVTDEESSFNDLLSMTQEEKNIIVQEIIYDYLQKILIIYTNFLYKHVSGYLRLPRLQNMCVLHSENTHLQLIIEELLPKTSEGRIIQLKGSAPNLQLTLSPEIHQSIKKLQQLQIDLVDKLSSEVLDISHSFWKKDDISKKELRSKQFSFLCCGGSKNISSPIDVSKHQIQRVIDLILQPAFESIACSHPVSRKMLIEIIVLKVLQSYLDNVKKKILLLQKKRKNHIWRVMKQFRNDVIYFHNWLMQSPLLTNSEKHFLTSLPIFEHIDAILLELDEKAKTRVNRSTKYSFTRSSDFQGFLTKKSTVHPIKENESNGPRLLKGQSGRKRLSFFGLHNATNDDYSPDTQLGYEFASTEPLDMTEWRMIFSSL